MCRKQQHCRNPLLWSTAIPTRNRQVHLGKRKCSRNAHTQFLVHRITLLDSCLWLWLGMMSRMGRKADDLGDLFLSSHIPYPPVLVYVFPLYRKVLQSCTYSVPNGFKHTPGLLIIILISNAEQDVQKISSTVGIHSSDHLPYLKKYASARW